MQMSKPAQKKKRADYPDETVGSKLAAEARKLGNSLTDEQRDDFLERAKALIYGGRHAKETARSGR